MRRISSIGRLLTAAVLATVVNVTAVSAQVDPLLFVKATQPNVILAIDVGTRMQRDAPTDPNDPLGTSSYYDTTIYPYSLLNIGVNGSLGLNSSNTSTSYRRKYTALTYANSGSSDKFNATGIVAVGNLQSSFVSFEAPTRMSLARASIDQVIRLNESVARFGLVKMRQLNPGLATAGNSGPVANSNPSQAVGDLGGDGKWEIGQPTVGGKNGNVSTSGLLVQADGAGATASVLTYISRNTRTANGPLPAGDDDSNNVDAPVKYMLDDARTEAARLIAADAACRNTVVVLVVGGGEGNTVPGANPASAANAFLNVSGRRVPVYVIAIAPASSDRSQLQSIATNSGGQYFEVTKAMIDAALASPQQPALNVAVPAGTVAVPEMVKAMNVAIQHAFASFADFNTGPTTLLPYGPSTEFATGSPIIGTVNLENAKDINGSTLPKTVVYDPAGAKIPQRSNVLLNSGFTLPGFDGKLRAFRTYVPTVDSTQQSGHKFVSDGTRLWVATVPSSSSRNIYTYIPGLGMTAFTTANASTLATYMNMTTGAASALIEYVRDQPLGAIVDSTPALMDPPSLDPPPDADYPGFVAANANRRTIVWVGTNDGMLHGIDGRLGQEVWAYIPFNLLPKLKEVRFGQSIGKFNYFADGSPKIADIRVSAPCTTGESSCWRTYLFVGEGPGGTFYQAFDVTLPDIGSTVSPTSDTIGDVLTYFSNPSKVIFKWSFPTYESFDYTLAPWGDVKSTASAVEKSVGQSWADPAVGKIESEAGKFALVLGSGFLPYTTQQQANRGGAVAGTTFYVLDVETGVVFDFVSVGADTHAESVDSCAVANDCTRIKNAIQADPVATGPPNSRFITMVYVGDLDGRVWRFDVGMSTSTGNPYIKNKPGTKLWDGGAAHPIFSSMATVNVGNTQQYVFFGTGSDLLPSNNVNQQYKLVGVLDSGSSGSQTFSNQLTKVDGVGADEKVSAFPAVAGDIVFFTTTTFNPSTPCTLPTAKLYAMTFIGGAAYDTSGDDKVTGADSIVLATVANVRATAPFVADRHLVFGTGTQTQIFGDPNAYNNGVGQAGVRILSWRDLR